MVLTWYLWVSSSWTPAGTLGRSAQSSLDSVLSLSVPFYSSWNREPIYCFNWPLNECVVRAILSSEGRLFHGSTTRFEKKPDLISRLHLWGTMFKGHWVALVGLLALSPTNSNQWEWWVLYLPVTIICKLSNDQECRGKQQETWKCKGELCGEISWLFFSKLSLSFKFHIAVFKIAGIMNCCWW